MASTRSAFDLKGLTQLMALGVALAPLVIFALAVGLWDGRNWINLDDFSYVLLAVAVAELVSVLSLFGYNFTDIAKIYTPQMAWHWILFGLTWHVAHRTPSQTNYPAGVLDSNDPTTSANPTWSDARRMMQFYVLLTLYMLDLVIMGTNVSRVMVLVDPFPAAYERVKTLSNTAMGAMGPGTGARVRM